MLFILLTKINACTYIFEFTPVLVVFRITLTVPEELNFVREKGKESDGESVMVVVVLGKVFVAVGVGIEHYFPDCFHNRLVAHTSLVIRNREVEDDVILHRVIRRPSLLHK